jgi:outer membrane protein
MKKIISIWILLLSFNATEAQILKDLLEKAKTNYPLLKAKRFESVAKEDQVRYMRSAAIPSVEAGYQVNYATYNNITGMATSQHFVPISGPPSTSNNSDAVLGSAGGLLMNWELFTFGQRKSKVGSAKASLEYQKADEQNEIFQHQIKTANVYLDLLISHELVKVYQRNLLRSEDNLRIVRSLARSGLRPGVDTALVTAELAKAKIELLNFEKLHQAKQLQLSELLGEDEVPSILMDSSYFSKLPVLTDTVSSGSHPLINLSTSKLRIAEYERTSLQRSLYPKLSLWGTAYGRGSGIRYDGFVSSEDGLSFSRYNVGAGLVLSVPLLQFARTQHQIRSQNAQVQADQERLNSTTLQINKQRQLAEITLVNSLKIANESPTFFEASNYAYKGLLSRYNSGLLNYTELIQSKYALLQSEADLKRAYVEAWKALLFMSAVNGDLNLFINQL